MKVEMVFDLPEGMTEIDLDVMLRDALMTFRTVRTQNGGVEAYVEKGYPFLKGEEKQKKIEEVEKRVEWSDSIYDQIGDKNGW